MEAENLKSKTITGIKWTGLSNTIKSILQIAQLVILARFLDIEDFGLIAIVMVVIGFSQLFMDMGISNAIIHKQEISETQLSSLYWLNILSGVVLTVLVFSIAPLVSDFYNEKKILPLLQLLSVTFFINAIGNQHKVLLRKGLKFNVLAKVEVVAAIGAFLCAVLLALNNFGAYSIVYAMLLNALILNSIFLFIGLHSHIPKLIYKHSEVKSFLTFGLYQMGQNSIVFFNNQLDVILIGKLLGTEALGVYSLTKQLVMRPAQIINPIVTNVTFPVMSKVQDDLTKLKSIYLQIINNLAALNFPIYILMIVTANTLVPLILGEKWIQAVDIFQVLSLYALIRSIVSPSGSLLLARGRADIGFHWSLVGLLVIPISIFIGSQWSLIGVAIALLIYQLLFLLPNWYFIVKKMCDASFTEYFKIIIKSLIIILTTTFMTYIIVSLSQLSGIYNILLWIMVGLVFYFLLLIKFNREFIDNIFKIIKKKN